jgi:hypothetical protein
MKDKVVNALTKSLQHSIIELKKMTIVIHKSKSDFLGRSRRQFISFKGAFFYTWGWLEMRIKACDRFATSLGFTLIYVQIYLQEIETTETSKEGTKEH